MSASRDVVSSPCPRLGVASDEQITFCGDNDMPLDVCIKLTDLAFPITVEQHPNDLFRVSYGAQMKDNLTYEQAAAEFGFSVFHALACDGKLRNEGE